MFVELRPPNLNADLYRNHQEIDKVYNYLNFINIHEDGTTIVGASDLVGRFCDGTIRISKSPWDFALESAGDSDIYKIFTEMSVTAGMFLKDSDKIIIADDLGELKVWSRQKSWSDMGGPTTQFGWCVSLEACEHDDGILSLDIFSDSHLCVTGGADSFIKIWDLEQLMSVMTIPAHGDSVTDVACNKDTKNVYLSSSLDRCVALWSYKGPEKDAKVYKSVPCAARCVCWISDTLFAAGYDNGDIYFYDSRYESTEQVIAPIHSNHSVERMKYSKEVKMLAECGDSNVVNVYKVNETDTSKVYSDSSSHSEFVRGLEWKDNSLFSCAWDGKVISHDISTHKSN